MITTKNLIILAAVLVVLGAVSFMQKSQHRKATNSSSTTVVVDGEFSNDNISRIMLGFGTTPDAVVLVSTPEGWIIESHFGARANVQKISTLLRNFSNLAGEFRSDSAKVLKQYGLEDDQCVTIRAVDKAGAEVLAINLGRTSQGYPGQFMRVPGSSKVYLSQTGMLSHLGIYTDPELPKVQFFLELQAVKESVANLDGMTLRDGETTMHFQKEFSTVEPAEGTPEGTPPTTDRNTWTWFLDGASASNLDKAKIDAALNACANIRANDVVDFKAGPAAYGLDAPSMSLALNRMDGSELVIEFGSTREAVADGVTAGTYMRVAGSETIWVVTSYTIKSIFKNRDDLKTE